MATRPALVDAPPLYCVLHARELASGDLDRVLAGTPRPWLGVLIGLEGSVRCELGRRSVALSPGTLVWFRPGQLAARRRARSAGADRLLLLVLGGEAANSHASFLERRFGSVLSLGLNDEPLLAASKLAQERAADAACPERPAHDWLVVVHRHLEAHRLRLAAIFDLDPDDPRLRAFAGFTIKQLASSLGYSRTYLSRILEARWGQPPGRVLRRQRLELAADLLTTTSDAVSQIAERAGFDSASAFCSSFRRLYGRSPGLYRTAGRRNPVQQGGPAGPSGRGRTRAALSEPVPATPHRSKFPDLVSAPDWDGPYFRLINCGEIDLPTPQPFEIAFSWLERRYIINMTLEGEALFELNGRTIRLSAGTSVVYPAPLNARLRTEPGRSRWRRIWLQFSGEWSDRFIGDVITRHGIVHRIPARSELVRQARRLVNRVRRGRAEAPLFWSEHAFHWLLDWRQLIRRTSQPGTATPLDLTRGQTRFLERPASSLVEYARFVGYSPSHLNERLKLQWNMTPGTALRIARIEHAARLLRSTSLPVSEIARRSGYAASGPLIVAFRRRHGVTPLVYRHRHREGG